MRRSSNTSETKIRRSNEQRVLLLEIILGVFTLIVAARLIEVQLLQYDEFIAQAESQHFGDVNLPVRRGEILSANSKTGETSILGTNTTLYMAYVDPLEVDEPAVVADTLANTIITEDIYKDCSTGNNNCPRELRRYFLAAFDPLQKVAIDTTSTGAILEPIAQSIPMIIDTNNIPDIAETKRLFAERIVNSIQKTRVTFVPLVYGANNKKIAMAEALSIAGLYVNKESRLIYANPEEMNPLRLPSTAKQLADIADADANSLQRMLRRRPLRYVPIMRKIPTVTSIKIKEILQTSIAETREKKIQNPEQSLDIRDPLRGVVIKPESWRYYPDNTIASQVLGFTNDQGEPQYGIERTFNPQLRGKVGVIRSASDNTGLQIVTSDQTLEEAEDGDTLVLSIDRLVQERVEEIMMADLQAYQSNTGQAIVMDPYTGKIIAMVNVPTFNANQYGEVFEKQAMYINQQTIAEKVVLELYHPETNSFIVRAPLNQVITASGRTTLSLEKQQEIAEIESLYSIEEIARYYFYTGEYHRFEIFPTPNQNVWMRYANKVGVGAYLNRNIQEIYEPGSVAKAITMAVAIDQGEIEVSDTYYDTGNIEVDEFTIYNAEKMSYGTVTMTNCLEHSINTCMTMISNKLGRKLFHRMLARFGFGKITGIELEDELTGELRPWKNWSQSELATQSFGQGISATPLQMVTAFAALANGGKLMKPSIIDSVIHADGTTTFTEPHVVDQVLKPETSATITAMLTSVVSRGQAKAAKVPGYKIAGKTGTSQIAGPGGKYETGPGSTRATFAGYAPINKPKFVILVKFDRPEARDYGSQTAAPTFKKIATFLFDYYGIPPDDF